MIIPPAHVHSPPRTLLSPARIMTEMSFSDPGFPVTPAADANSAVDLLSQPPSYHSEYYIQDGMTEFLVSPHHSRRQTS